MILPRPWSAILSRGCARCASMPAGSSLHEAQPLCSANCRGRIHDFQSIPAYLFCRATAFNQRQNSRRNSELTSSARTSGGGTQLEAKIVYVDRDLDNGSCPATLRLSEGAHTLTLKSPHHADWQRSITVLRDSVVTVKATLVSI